MKCVTRSPRTLVWIFFAIFISSPALAFKLNLGKSTCNLALDKNRDAIAEISRTLKSQEFWLGLKLEKLIPYIDPTILKFRENPRDIFEAFGKDFSKETGTGNDWVQLQHLLEGLGLFFLQDENVLQDYYDRELPVGAKDAHGVATDLFVHMPDGPTRYRILKTFILHKMLSLGAPRKAANLILTDMGFPSRRDKGLINPDVWNRGRYLPALMSLGTSVKIKVAKGRLYWETIGKGDVMLALLRPTYEHYFVNVAQYQNSTIPRDVIFSDLPEKYKDLALEKMNQYPVVSESRRTMHPGVAGEKPVREGKWDRSFIGSIMYYGHENRAAILSLGPTESGREPKSNQEREELIKQSFSDGDYAAYRDGMNQARDSWEADFLREKAEILNILYVYPEKAYQELLQSQRGVDDSKKRVAAASQKWPTLSSDERGQERKSMSEESIAQWNDALDLDVSNFARAILRAYALSDILGLQIDPRHQAAFENNPAIRLAAVKALVDAEKTQTEEQRSEGEKAFESLLLPKIHDQLFPYIRSTAHPLGIMIVESYRAKSYKEISAKSMANISKLATWLAAVGVVWGVAQPLVNKWLEPPPFDKTRIWIATHLPIDSMSNPLGDKGFDEQEGTILDSMLQTPLPSGDERNLAAFARNVDVSKIPDKPAHLKQEFTAMLKDPDFQYFHDWKPRLDIRGNEQISAELYAKHKGWVQTTLEVMRVMKWEGAKALDAKHKADGAELLGTPPAGAPPAQKIK